MKQFVPTCLIALLGCLMIQQEAQSQQDIQSSTYFMAPLPFNPAFSGLSEETTVRSISRLQWLGWGGAPVTHVVTVDAPFYREYAGAGLVLIQDQIGARMHTSIMGSCAAHLRLNDGVNLSFGLNGGMRYNSFDLTQLQADDPMDALYAEIFQSWTPNFGAGTYLTTEKAYFGLSVPHILQEQLSDSAAANKLGRHHYLMAGWRNGKLRLGALLKGTQDAPWALDMNVLWSMSEAIGVGATWRVGESVGLLFQANLSSDGSLRGMYCMEMPYNKLVYNNFGTHELGLIWSPNRKVVANSRYF